MLNSVLSTLPLPVFIRGKVRDVYDLGDHLLMVDSCYEPTRIFCDRTLKRFGIETTYYPPGDDIAPYLKVRMKLPTPDSIYCARRKYDRQVDRKAAALCMKFTV